MARLQGVSALALIAMAQPALADVTPRQVWDDLTTYMEGFGYEVSGQETMDGGTLIVSGVVMNIPIPEEDTSVQITMDEVSLTETGDGSVSIAFPEVMPILFSGDDGTLRLDYTHDGLEMIVSGDERVLTYAYTARQLGLTLAELMVDGEAIGREDARFDMTVGPIEGRSQTTYGDAMREIEQSMTLGEIAYSAAFNDPDSDDRAVMSGALMSVTATGFSAIPDAFEVEDMQAAVAAGFGGSGRIMHEGSRLEFSVDGSDPASGSMESGSGFLNVGFSGDGLLYELRNAEYAMSLTTQELPFPINVEMAETAFKLMMPIEASDEPQDAALVLTLSGFQMSDMLWDIFDPGAALPRDPATVAMDLTAQLTPFFSLLDTEQMEELGMTDEVPGELNSMTLNSLRVDAAGVTLTGDGAFTFDNSDLETFDGMPRPTGKINLQLQGHNGLIDTLIEMGILAQEDAMGARMMLSMFTVPGSGEDSATSTIEINDQAQIFANGQRIQ